MHALSVMVKVKKRSIYLIVFGFAAILLILYLVNTNYYGVESNEEQLPDVVYRLKEGITCEGRPAGTHHNMHTLSKSLQSYSTSSMLLETVISSPPPVFLEANHSSHNIHTFLSAYQVRWTDDSTANRSGMHDTSTPIPRIVHYVFISTKTFTFSLGAYLSIRATVLRIKPDAIYLHCYKEPSRSPYYILSKPMISKVVIHEPLTTIFGRKVNVVEHVSDVIRMRVLLKYGGIYMDGDVIPLKSFDVFLYHSKPMTMGLEDKQKQIKMPDTVMIGQKDNPFLTRWIESYKTFNDKHWAEHSVIMPGKLACKHPDEINVESIHSFLSPYFGEESIKTFFRKTSMKNALKNNYAVHLWYRKNKHYINGLTPSIIFDCDVGLNEILRPLLPHPFVSFMIEIDADKLGTQKHSQEILQSITSIALQSFPLWEILIDTGKSDNRKLLTKLHYRNPGDSKFTQPYYSCNLTSLTPTGLKASVTASELTELTNTLGEKIKGSTFSRLRCGSVSFEQVVSFPQPESVRFEDENGTESIARPLLTMKEEFIDTNEVIRPRGVWLVSLVAGEVLPSDFLDSAFEQLLKTQNSAKKMDLHLYNWDSGHNYTKNISFVFGQ